MFTPIHTFLGGILLHISTSTLLARLGRVFGGSSIVDGALFGDRASWRWAVVAGLLIAPLLNRVVGVDAAWAVHAGGLAVEPVRRVVSYGLARMLLAGYLVGVGSKLGCGCTSGHFLCGSSRLSRRSLAATATFMTTAIITAWLTALPVSVSDSVSASTSASLVVPSYTPQWPSLTPTSLIPLFLLPLAAHIATTTLLRTSSSASNLTAFVCGYIFTTGLELSGMASSVKVLRFLHLPVLGLFDVAEWDPSLGFVVLGGVVPNAIHWAKVIKPRVQAQLQAQRGTPRSPTSPTSSTITYHLPTTTRITPHLLIGSAIFGIGWGLSGTCLLPAVVNAGKALAGQLDWEEVSDVGAFLGAMVGGMWAVRRVGF